MPMINKPLCLYSGMQGLDAEQFPSAFLKELKLGFRNSRSGVSAFHLSCSLKYLMCGGLGMVEYDAVNAHVQMMLLLFSGTAGSSS